MVVSMVEMEFPARSNVSLSGRYDNEYTVGHELLVTVWSWIMVRCCSLDMDGIACLPVAERIAAAIWELIVLFVGFCLLV
jgi:hypothetical protein